ncbi:MAG: SulP family sulfate permease [Hyphomicrobiaceae bacterium]|jgi:SulP family sulfate permease
MSSPSEVRPSAFRGDLFGGITAGIVALPLALAFGVSSGLGATYGLYGAIFIGFFAAIFGGTASQISGPTGPMTVVTTATVTTMIGVTGSLDAAIPALVATFVLAGIIQILMGVVRIGSLIKFIPYPVVSGFMSGIGVIIVLLQIYPSFGLVGPKKTLDVAKSVMSGSGWDGINFAAFGVTVATVAIIYLFPKITKAVPSVLVALLALTIVSTVAGLSVPIIGDIPSGFPKLQLGGFGSISSELYGTIVITAITLAALGALDSLLTSVVADNLTKTQHNSNRELFGQGVGNAISGLFLGLPGAGATMRTVVNVRAGGSTRKSGAIHALLLLAVLLGAGAYASHIPKPVLAGILITVGIGILDYRGLKHIAKVPRTDAIIMVVVLFVTVFLDLLIAVGIGMVMGIFRHWQVIVAMVFKRGQQATAAADVELPHVGSYWDNEPWADESHDLGEQVVVKRISGPLFFAFAAEFRRRLDGLTDARFVILRLDRVSFVDQSGAYALDEAVRGLELSGVTVVLVGLRDQPDELLSKLSIVPGTVPSARSFESFAAGIAFVSDELPAKP